MSHLDRLGFSIRRMLSLKRSIRCVSYKHVHKRHDAKQGNEGGQYPFNVV